MKVSPKFHSSSPNLYAGLFFPIFPNPIASRTCKQPVTAVPKKVINALRPGSTLQVETAITGNRKAAETRGSRGDQELMMANRGSEECRPCKLKEAG
jgi:hypothetical protein